MAGKEGGEPRVTLQEELVQLQKKYGTPNENTDTLQFTIDAAELHLKHLRLASSPEQKKTLKTKTLALFEEAEKIKKDASYHAVHKVYDLCSLSAALPAVTDDVKQRSVGRNPTTSIVKPLTTPTSLRPLSVAEQKLLLVGSKLNGAIFPPWTDADESEFVIPQPGGRPFVDSYVFHMSTKQAEMLDDWKRPIEALPPPFWPSPVDLARTSLPEFMRSHTEIDLVQDAATDCSVVASLTAAHARRKRGFEKILSSIIRPYDHELGQPRVSESGRYIVRLNFNGTFRKVVIDDRLPVSETSHILHVVDRNNPTLLWPALIEKAYMKVCGGYDFPGSNSATDLWAMIGWIPEQVLLQHDDTEPEKLWQRIKKAFSFGDVLVTLGTGKLSHDVEREAGLIGEHNYTLLDLDDTSDQKRFLIKNPWVRGVERASVAAPRPQPFWSSLQDVVHSFESMYLSWNPGLFRYRQDTHFSWDMQNKGNFRSPIGSFVRNPQYTFAASASGPVWVLLSKHFTTRDETSYTLRRPEFLSLYLFANDGRRVIWSKGAIAKAPYVDSPQALLKMDAEAGVKYTLVVSGQDLIEVKHNFSLSIFSGSSLNLELAPDSYERSISTESGWTPDSAGGRSDLPSYSRNPQFALELTSRSALCLTLETTAANLRTHAVLVHGKNQRIFTISTRDVLFDSGSYRSPCAIAVTKEAIPAGHYTIICSTYEANELGKFTLTIMSDAPATVKAIPREGGGRLRLSLQPGRFRGDIATIAAPLAIYRMCRISLTARHQQNYAGNSAPSPFSISVERGRGPDKCIGASVKTGLDGGIDHVLRTREMDLRPEMSRMETVWIVLERNDGYEGVATSDEFIGVDIWMDVMNAVAVGEWQDR